MSHFRQAAAEASDLIGMCYDGLEGWEDLATYHDRHGTPSLCILTQHSPEIAANMARLLANDIDGLRVVEIGAGVGFLALEMAQRAKSVVAIEADPAWSWVFTKSLYRHKPENLTWIFGMAESVADVIRADVAVICTRSGAEQMRAVAERMAPRVIMPFQDWNEAKLQRADTDGVRALRRVAQVGNSEAARLRGQHTQGETA